MMKRKRTYQSTSASKLSTNNDFLKYVHQIQTGRIETVYILFGADHPGKNDFINELKGSGEFKIEEYTMSEAISQNTEKVNDLLSKIFTLSLWGERSLFIIYDFQNLISKTQQDILDRLATLPQNYFATVVIESKYSKALQTLFNQYNFPVLNFFQPDEKRIIQFVMERAKNLGLIIEYNASKMLIDLIGNDYQAIQQELNKIKTYLGSETRVNVDTVLNACGLIKESSIDDLVNATYNRNLKQSLINLYRLKNDNIMPVMIVAYLANSGFQLLQIILGASQESIGEFGVGKLRFQALLKQSKHWSSKELTNFLLELSKIDKKIKTGYPEPYVLLENLIVRTTGNYEEN